MKKLLSLAGTVLFYQTIFFAHMAKAQSNDIDNLLDDKEEAQTVYVKNAFKSSRVINGQSMEMLGEGVLDFRILHRFGMVSNGLYDLFGLDQASMRMGFDYGINKNISVGIGRSTFNKEYDGFIKYRLLQQRSGAKAFPISVLLVHGMTIQSTRFPLNGVEYSFAHRLGYFHQAIFGRKFSDAFTLQLSPTFVHRNLVSLATDKNNMLACGIGSRFKMSNRTALVLDAYPLLYGARKNYNKMPLSIGLDIETGGHVFQLHFSNSRGMNEKAFITETTQNWGKGEFNFGFNLSRVFTVKANTASSW